MAAINAPIPGWAGAVAAVELEVLAAAAAGVAVRAAGLAGGEDVTRLASGSAVTMVVSVVKGIAGVLTATPSPEPAAERRLVIRAAKGFATLVICPEVADPVFALWVCAGSRPGVVRVIEC